MSISASTTATTSSTQKPLPVHRRLKAHDIKPNDITSGNVGRTNLSSTSIKHNLLGDAWLKLEGRDPFKALLENKTMFTPPVKKA
ncbi:hypothetical protein KIN20_021176 [Parelaphostrongylus tenuis]|uniref:Uncharacterized protein n=1 Tax=Parelaphostrongylus tenuis TaxID=148309 RepID=A0AAD5QW08_PARTN|nr:hypothetical protein KIN20_021176 [Parelaphostrongylus tenuis]